MFSKSAENGFGAVKLLQSDLYRRARRGLSQWISSRGGGDEKSQNLERDLEWNPTLAHRTRKDGAPGRNPTVRSDGSPPFAKSAKDGPPPGRGNAGEIRT